MEGSYDYFMLTNLIICQLTSTSNHLIDPGGGGGTPLWNR